jgi:F1F0 ATPase subunit 2
MGDVALGLTVGIAAGLVFFGGLRWTVDRLEHARRPVALVVVSLLVRVSVVAGALVAVAGGSITRVLSGLAGLLIVRTAMVAVTRHQLEVMGVSLWT